MSNLIVCLLTIYLIIGLLLFGYGLGYIIEKEEKLKDYMGISLFIAYVFFWPIIVSMGIGAAFAERNAEFDKKKQLNANHREKVEAKLNE